MLKEASLSINQDTLSNGESLREGTFVYIRVLEKKENNKYQVSFAGNRFEVFSEKDLKPGESFRAKLIVKNGLVLLEPAYDENLFLSQKKGSLSRFLSKNVLSTNNQNNKSLQAFFSNLNLPTDDFSFKIIQCIQQFGLRFDFSIATMARKFAIKFSGKEKEVLELIILLKSKGIEPSEETILELLAALHGCSSTNDNLENFNKKKENDSYWIIIPFEYKFGDNISAGSIRLEKNTKINVVNKVFITSYNKKINFFFRIYLKNGNNKAKINMNKIIFYSNPPLTDVQSKEVVNSLYEYLKDDIRHIEIEYSEIQESNGFFTDDSEIISVSTEA